MMGWERRRQPFSGRMRGCAQTSSVSRKEDEDDMVSA